MQPIEIIQLLLFFAIGIALTPVLGRFMARVFNGERTFLYPALHPVEKAVYWATGVDPKDEMSWTKYLGGGDHGGHRLRRVHGDADDAEVAAPQSAGPGQPLLAPRVQHRVELHLQR